MKSLLLVALAPPVFRYLVMRLAGMSVKILAQAIPSQGLMTRWQPPLLQKRNMIALSVSPEVCESLCTIFTVIPNPTAECRSHVEKKLLGKMFLSDSTEPGLVLGFRMSDEPVHKEAA